MALSFTWNAAYEATPGSGLSRNSLDNELRRITSGIRERMEREHNFGPNTDSDDGTHIPGKTTVLLTGNAAARTALSDMQEGALYLQNDGTNYELFLYTASAWLSITNDIHANMDNLEDDLAHTQYMLKDTLYDVSATVDMNTKRLSTLASTGAPLVADHPYDDDPHAIVAATAIADGVVDFTSALRGAYLYVLSGSYIKPGAPTNYNFVLPSTTRAIIQVLLEAEATASGAADQWQYGCLPDGGSPHFTVRENSIFSRELTWQITVVTTS